MEPEEMLKVEGRAMIHHAQSTVLVIYDDTFSSY